MKIPHFVAFAFVVLVCLFSARVADAHHGFESAVEVRLLENQTFVVVRMTERGRPFARLRVARRVE